MLSLPWATVLKNVSHGVSGASERSPIYNKGLDPGLAEIQCNPKGDCCRE
ncbi:hypothetical protein ACP70R_004977 [Stipagrostis hirtigluma subsp. patula]